MFRLFLFFSISFCTCTFVVAAEVDCSVKNSVQQLSDGITRVSNWKEFSKPKEYHSIDEFPASYINQFYYQPDESYRDKKIVLDFDENLAKKASVRLAIRMRYLGHDTNKKRALVSEYFIPDFYYEVVDGMIAGSDRGEFGGAFFHKP